jgi:hypothetical protein
MVGTCRTHDGDDKKENEDCNPKLRPEVEVWGYLKWGEGGEHICFLSSFPFCAWWKENAASEKLQFYNLDDGKCLKEHFYNTLARSCYKGKYAFTHNSQVSIAVSGKLLKKFSLITIFRNWNLE